MAYRIPSSVWMIARSVLLASVLFASLNTSAQKAGAASRYYEDALSRYEQRNYAGAIIQLKNALQIDKSILQVHALLGKALLANDEFAAAEVALEEALRLGVSRDEVVVPLARSLIGQAKQTLLLTEPRFAEQGLTRAALTSLLIVKASAAIDTGDPKTALKLIEAARRIDPADPQSWVAEIMVRSRAGQFAEAKLAADQALTLQPNDAQAIYLRGTVSHLQGDLKSALSYYDRALKTEPSKLEALVSRAGLLTDLKRSADAKSDVAQIRRLSPRDPRGAYLSALIAERERRSTDARRDLNDVTNLLDPVPIEFLRYRPQLLMLGGLAHYGLSQSEKAKPYLDGVLKTQPGSPAAKLLAQIHIGENSVDRAISILDEYLRAHPDDRQAIQLLASAYIAQGRHGRAVSLLQRAIEKHDGTDIRGALGASLLGAGDFAAAIPELKASWSAGSGQTQAGAALAALYLQLGEPSKAVTVADALVARDSQQPGLLLLQGTARLAAGDRAGARAALEQALKIAPDFVAPQIELARLAILERAYAEARKRLNTALAKDSTNRDAMVASAELHAAQGQVDEARRWLAKADDHGGRSDLDAAMRLVQYDLANRRPDLAAESLKRLTGKAPDVPRVLVMSARVSLANGDPDAARSSLTRAAGQVAYDAPALVQIASLQIAADHLPGAAHSLDKALSESPADLQAQALRTEVAIRQGDFTLAEQGAKQISAANRKSGIGPMLMGDLAIAQRRRPAAVAFYRQAHQIEPGTRSLLRLVAAMYPDHPEAALDLSAQWLKTHPTDTAVWRAIGDGQAQAGKLTAARASYETLSRLQPEDAEAANNLANVLILTKDPLALKVAERALALRPDAAHIIGTVGWAAFNAGQTDRALQLLRDARLRNPTNPDTRYFLAAVLAKAGRVVEARIELQAALGDGRPFAHMGEARQLLAQLK